jgi:hypothetical protein
MDSLDEEDDRKPAAKPTLNAATLSEGKPAALPSPKQPDNKKLHVMYEFESNNKPGEYLTVAGNMPSLILRLPNPGARLFGMDRPFTNTVFYTGCARDSKYENGSDVLEAVDTLLFRVRTAILEYIHKGNINISRNKFYDFTEDSDDEEAPNI